MSHGSKSHRAPGSIGAGTTPGRVFKGMKMAGHMGNRRVKMRKLEVRRGGWPLHGGRVAGQVGQVDRPASARTGVLRARTGSCRPGMLMRRGLRAG